MEEEGAYGSWLFHEKPYLFTDEGISVTVLGERLGLYTGRRQHVILEDTILNWRNAEWYNVKELLSSVEGLSE